MPYFSHYWQIAVRESIVQKWTDRQGKVDDMMAGLHEIRARLVAEDPELQKFAEALRENGITVEELE